MKRIILLTLFLFFYGNIISQNLNPSSENIIYVKQGAKGTNDGSSWENAHPDLAEVLHWADTNKARWENKPLQIWVAIGRYHPKYTTTGNNSNPKNRENTFMMVKNVKLYGGFAGGETSIEERRWISNQTTLSGDFNNDDSFSGEGASLKIFNNSENAFRVVYATGDVGSAVLDGFNIIGGHNPRILNTEDDYGAGIYINGASLVLKNLKINRNKATYGAGIVVFSSSPKIGNVWIDKNWAITGAAMYLSGSNSGITIYNSLITNNYGEEAGALRCFNIVNFVNVTIANNYANRHKIGGAVSNRNKVTINFYNSIIHGNTASGGESSDITNLSPSISREQEGQNRVSYHNSYVKEIGNYDSNGRYVSGFGIVGDNEQRNVKGNIKSDLSPFGSNFELRPLASNQAVNGGDNSYFLSEYGNEDLFGEQRIVGANIDMGVFETECVAPIITTQPTTVVTSCVGQTVTLSIVGENITKYQWQVDKNDGNGFVNLNNDATYNGVTSNNLIINTSTGIHNYNYKIVVDGNCGYKEISTTTTLQVFETPPPTANEQQFFCSNAKVSDLKATGENLKWYENETSNTSLSNTTALRSGDYFVTQTQNGCESAKVKVEVVVNQTPTPTADLQQTFCHNAKVSDLTATGDNLKWYDASDNLLNGTTDLQSGKYFVTQTLNDCESEKLEITVTIHNTAKPTANEQQIFCNNAKVSDLVANGNELKWYNTSNIILEDTTVLQSGKYFVTQTLNNCESEKLEVTVTIHKTEKPTANTQQIFCHSAKVANLVANGTLLKWYDASDNLLNNTTNLQTGKYFVTQTLNNCESEKLEVMVTIHNTAKPTANAQQTFCHSAKVSDLVANGNNLKWYDASGTELNNTTTLQSGKYFVTQTLNDCESEKTEVSVIIENVSITGVTEVIIGNTITLKASKKMGIWSVSNPSLASINPNDDEVIVRGTSIGNVLITYELPNGCKSSHQVNILRNPLQCTRLINPYNHSSLVPLDTELQWEMVEEADGYRISVGTSSEGSEIIENQVVNGQNNTSFRFANDLPAGRTIYVRIVPFNRWGDAMECSEESFTTIAKGRHFKQGFSPNGDGINDIWEIEAIEQYPNNRVSIFNRWGDMVFYVEGYNNKDKAFRGQANRLTKLGAGTLPEGTYFFIIEIDGKHPYTKLNGSLELRR